MLEQAQAEVATRHEGLLPPEYLRLVQAHEKSLQLLQRYFIEPDSAAYENALATIDLSQIMTKSIFESQQGQPSQKLGKELREQLSQFRKLGSRAVLATRSYMFYSNVVMAGEISEFVYNSNRLKSYVEEQRVENRVSRKKAADGSRTMGLLASMIAVAAAILMATRLSVVVVSPISLLTETFRRIT